MPGVNPPAGDWLGNVLRGLRADINAITTQQSQSIYDALGHLRVQIGQLSTGDFGLGIFDPVLGISTEILPVYEANVAAPQGTTSTTYTDLATAGPLVPATIGASGQALLTVNSYVGVGGVSNAASAGFVGVSIDGAPPAGSLDEIIYFSVSNTSASAVGMAANQSAQVVVGGLTPGQHTFEMKYKTVGGLTVTFNQRFLQVRPL